MTISRKIYVGSGENGIRLNKAIEEKANEFCHGNVSRILIYTFCEKHRINPRTGKPLKAGEATIKC